MPAWEPTPVAAEVASSAEAEAFVAEAVPVINERSPRRCKATRRMADPFDSTDDRANCLRCGYVIERTQAKRGLMTCAECE
jgi:adenine-specific DNA methylase